MTVFLQFLGSWVAKAVTKPFSVLDGDKDTWFEIATKKFDANVIELKLAHKNTEFQKYKLEVQGTQCYHDSKWLCGL